MRSTRKKVRRHRKTRKQRGGLWNPIKAIKHAGSQLKHYVGIQGQRTKLHQILFEAKTDPLVEVQRHLQEHPEDLDKKTGGGKTALDIAVARGFYPTQLELNNMHFPHLKVVEGIVTKLTGEQWVPTNENRNPFNDPNVVYTRPENKPVSDPVPHTPEQEKTLQGEALPDGWIVVNGDGSPYTTNSAPFYKCWKNEFYDLRETKPKEPCYGQD